MSSDINLVQREGKLAKDFKVKKCIGNGSYGTVYQVKLKSDKSIHAIKKIKFDSIDDEFWVSGITELKALNKAKSDFVVQYRSAWIENNYLCLQMEFCDNNLNDIIKDKSHLFHSSYQCYELATIEFFISCELFHELVESLQFLHSLNPPIIHRDIKPENILVLTKSEKQFLKLCDFGYAKHYHFSGQSLTRDKGSISFMAPEVSQSKIYDSKSDVYSVGLIGHLLFGIEFDRWDKSISKKNKEIQYKYKSLEEPFLDILETRWRKRPTCAQILSRSHNWSLNIEEITAINEEFHSSVQLLRKFKQKFFYNFLLNKIDLRLSVARNGFSTDTNQDHIDGSLLIQDKIKDKDNNELRIGDILQITLDGDYDIITLWALNLSDGYIMYLKPLEDNECVYRLFKEKLSSITQNKSYVRNNLYEFAKTRGLAVQEPEDIEKIADLVFEKYSNQDLSDINHNLRIHFVTKCRYGRGICPKKDSLEEETTIFKT